MSLLAFVRSKEWCAHSGKNDLSRFIIRINRARFIPTIYCKQIFLIIVRTYLDIAQTPTCQASVGEITLASGLAHGRFCAPSKKDWQVGIATGSSFYWQVGNYYIFQKFWRPGFLYDSVVSVA